MKLSFMVKQLCDRLIAEDCTGDPAGFLEDCRSRGIEGYGVFTTRTARHAWKVGPSADGRLVTRAYASVLLKPAPATPENYPAAFSRFTLETPYFPGV